jgi:acetyl esterase/lipase
VSSQTVSTTLIPDVVYVTRGEQPLGLDILRPDPVPAEPMPLVVELHAGAWMYGGKHAERNRPLAEQGFCTASVDYRPSTEAPFPAQIEDVRAAVRFLRANAGRYHIDPDRVGVWGDSSGGHLAALLGTAGDRSQPAEQPDDAVLSAQVQAVGVVSAPTDLVLLNNQFVPPLLGGPIAEHKELAALASPLTFVATAKRLPPFLIIHGDEDQQVPIEHAELLRDALTAAGADVEYVPLHGGHNLFGSTSAGTVRSRLVDFFTRRLAD